jgi:hypothetical protein
MKTTHTTPCVCLACGDKLDAATDVEPDGHGPREGDASMCLTCGHMMIFTADLTMREPTAKEAAELNADPRVAYMQATHRKLKNKRTN